MKKWIPFFVAAALFAGSDQVSVEDYISTRVNIEDQKTINRYIITGGPGVGKTTIANFLNNIEGCASIDEAATRIIQRELDAGVAKPWEDPRFTQKILDLQREDRALAEEQYADMEHLFFDRSPIDAFTYSLYHQETPYPEIIEEVSELVRYFNSHVFLVENFGECENTPVRPESIEEAMMIERLIEKSYRSLGFEIVRVKPGSVEDRVREMLKAIQLQ